MQEEALAELDARRATTPTPTRVHAVPLPTPDGTRVWSASSPSRLKDRFHRPDDRLRARRAPASSRARAARSPAFTCATRSTSSPSARRASLAKFGGHAYRRGTLARRSRPAALRGGVRGGRPRAAHARAAPRARSKPTARSAPASSTFELARGACATRSGARAFRRRCSTTRFAVARPADRRRQALAARARARRRERVRRDPVQPRRAAAAVDPRGLPPRGQRMERHGVAAARRSSTGSRAADAMARRAWWRSGIAADAAGTPCHARNRASTSCGADAARASHDIVWQSIDYS